jgi:transcription antitermination factor NusG
MPLLAAEVDVFPPALLDASDPGVPQDCGWWVLHTRPRQEKAVARQLLAQAVPFYLPTILRRLRIRGRSLNSHVPLFPGYVFLLGNREQRCAALATNRIVRSLPVSNQESLWHDLRQIRRLIATGKPIAAEDRLIPGAVVEISGGPLAGLKGKIIRTAAGRRFVVEVDFIQRGASVTLDDHFLTSVR